jgi:hypothetical protein
MIAESQSKMLDKYIGILDNSNILMLMFQLSSFGGFRYS